MTLYSHVLPDGRTAEVLALTFGRARIAVIETPGVSYQYGQVW